MKLTRIGSHTRATKVANFPGVFRPRRTFFVLISLSTTPRLGRGRGEHDVRDERTFCYYTAYIGGNGFILGPLYFTIIIQTSPHKAATKHFGA
jgi:hypothetical protein